MTEDQKRLVEWWQRESQKPKKRKFAPNRKAEYLMQAIGERVAQLLKEAPPNNYPLTPPPQPGTEVVLSIT